MTWTRRRADRKPSSTTQPAAAQRSHRPDYQILLYTGLLMLLGLIVMYAIGPQRAQVLNAAAGDALYGSSYFVIKQFVSILLALAVMAVLVFVPLWLLRRYAGTILVVGLGLSAALLLFGNLLHVDALVQCTNGACRWINLGPFGSFQPAELLKFGSLIFVARLLAEQIQRGTLNDWRESLQPILIVVGVVVGVVVIIQQDMGTGIALSSIIASMFVAAGLDRSVGTKLLIGALVLGACMIIIAPHRVERVLTFFQGDSVASNSNDSSLDENYQIRHAKIAIGSGGLTGVGIGNSVEATGYLPEAINDSLFAILGEMFGFVGLLVLIVIFAALLMRILRVSDLVLDPWMRLVAAGVFGWLAAHIVLNIASMIGIFPLTGITLPLLSFGGTSMLFISAAIGLVFHISRYTSHERYVKEEASHADFSRGRRVGRTRDAGNRRHQ